jgi:GxxExxY protein
LKWRSDFGIARNAMASQRTQRINDSKNIMDFPIGTLTENEIAAIVFESALKIHKILGPGLLENIYKQCLAYELQKRGLTVEVEKGLPVEYDVLKFDVGYRMDLYINNMVVVETKSIRELTDVDFAQTLTYLRLSECRLGLLINFNVTLLKNGFKRVANGLEE